MSKDFVFDVCVLCCTKPADSVEHVFPRMLGGRLAWRMLCRDCNSRMGKRFVTQLRRDPMVVLAIDAVAPRLPDRVKKILTEGQRVVVPGPDEAPIVIERRRGRDKVKTRKAKDGSLLADTSTAASILEGRLTKAGASSDEIARFLDRLESAPVGTVVNSGVGHAVVKHPITGGEPDLSGEPADDRVAAVIAFGYLALLLGDLICEGYFDSVRAWLNGGQKPANVDVTRFYSGTYATDHAVASRQEGSDFVVQVVLFGGVVVNIKFRGLAVNGIHFVCVDDLKAGRVLVGEGLLKAANGEFHQI